MSKSRILIIEDEVGIRQLLAYSLLKNGFEVEEAVHAGDGRLLLERHAPDLVLLDLMLPGLSGMDFLARLRRVPATRDLPVIILSARGEEAERIAGLEAGADDYVCKPFSPRELLARIRAVLRRRARDKHHQDPLQVEALFLDPATYQVRVGHTALQVSPKEFLLLHFFMSHPERVHERGHLLDQVWGLDTIVDERTVDVHMGRLRKLLEPHGLNSWLQTVRGVGYRFSPNVPRP